MTAQDALFTYQRPGFRFVVYPNRIEIEDRASTFGKALTGGTTETILLRNVTDVSVGGLARRLRLTTNDGQRRELNLGPQAEAARAAIAGAL